MALPLRVTSSLFRRTRSPVAAAWELSAPAWLRRPVAGGPGNGDDKQKTRAR